MATDSWGNSTRDIQSWLDQEWLEADGLGGFASGTAAGIRTRRYQALLLTALNPPTSRCVLVNGFEAAVETESGSQPLSSQFYWPDVVYPRGIDSQSNFTTQPWPKWTFHLSNGLVIRQELFVPRGKSAVFIRWAVDPSTNPSAQSVTLKVRPLLSCRDYHSLHRENAVFRFEPLSNMPHTKDSGGLVEFQPYSGLPIIRLGHNGQYTQQPEWYRNFLYLEERSRGLDCIEDLAAPGVFAWDLTQNPAFWLLTPGTPHGLSVTGSVDQGLWDVLTERERRRRSEFASPAVQAANSYLARRDSGLTIVAGYPWFTDWGRDTFIALRGLCLATGRLAEARQILLAWSKCVVQGMLPNRFPDSGTEPEFNSVDASLWFVVASYELIQLAETTNLLSEEEEDSLLQAIEDILRGYRHGTRYGIRCDSDGLLAAGEAGMALTWMDARIEGEPVTPRIGKPVEIQALWINALRIGEILLGRTEFDWRLAQSNFTAKFWQEDLGYLADTVDVNHESGRIDTTLRPNQVLAVGGLPFRILDDFQANRLLKVLEQHLLTPIGLRTLAPEHPNYQGRYQGGVASRDSAYHQGTVWTWLLGPFVEGWVRAHGSTVEARQAARQRFLDPLIRAAAPSGGSITHLAEIADGDAPHHPRGCPFQAWSLGEYLRLDFDVLTDYTRQIS